MHGRGPGKLSSSPKWPKSSPKYHFQLNTKKMLGEAVWAFRAKKEAVHMEIEKQVLVGSYRDKGTQWTLDLQVPESPLPCPTRVLLQMYLGIATGTGPFSKLFLVNKEEFLGVTRKTSP